MRFVLLFLLLVALPARAFPLAEVEALQFPAWVERDGVREPLRPGAELKPGDVLRVGEGARAWLRLSDGSRVKLGEKTDVRIDHLALAKTSFTVAFEMVRGAFRLTAGTDGKGGRRDIRIKVGAGSLGIHGADLWGNSDGEKDLVCLIDGQAVVQHGSKILSLQDPLSFLEMPKGQPPRAVAVASRELVEKWAKETELETGAGVGKRGGEWKVNLFSSPDPAVVQEMKRRLEENGYPVLAMEVTVKGTAYRRLRIDNLADRTEAQALSAKLKGRYGLGEPWVSMR